MKTISIIICILCINTAIYAQYIASTVDHVSSTTVAQGSLNNPVIRIKIDVGATPIDLYSLSPTTGNSTNPSIDIDSIKIFYTGNSNIFSITTPYTGGIYPISSGTNYFWVAYDISATAIVCDTIDADCYSIYVTGGTQTPSVTDPSGFALVGPCATGIQNISTDNIYLVYPNPSNGQFQFSIDGSPVTKNCKIEIYNVQGKRIYQSAITNPKSDIDLSNPTSGIYFVTFYNGQTILTKKIVIE